MAFNPCDLPWASLRGTCSRRVVRHKDQKSFRAIANTDSQASEEESNAHSIAGGRTKTKESLANSNSEPDAEIKAKETIGDART